MRAWQSKEPELAYGGKPQRLVFYNVPYSDMETQKIKEFKEYCKKKGIKIPDVDAEILKCLHGEKFNMESTFKAVNERHNYLNKEMPKRVSAGTFDLL